MDISRIMAWNVIDPTGTEYVSPIVHALRRTSHSVFAWIIANWIRSMYEINTVFLVWMRASTAWNMKDIYLSRTLMQGTGILKLTNAKVARQIPLPVTTCSGLEKIFEFEGISKPFVESSRCHSQLHIRPAHSSPPGRPFRVFEISSKQSWTRSALIAITARGWYNYRAREMWICCSEYLLRWPYHSIRRPQARRAQYRCWCSVRLPTFISENCFFLSLYYSFRWLVPTFACHAAFRNDKLRRDQPQEFGSVRKEKRVSRVSLEEDLNSSPVLAPATSTSIFTFECDA